MNVLERVFSYVAIDDKVTGNAIIDVKVGIKINTEHS